MNINENFATNLVRFRKTLKLTQAEFAEKINYSDKAVSKWERGESVPDIYTLYDIAKFFKVSVDELISQPKEKNGLIQHLKDLNLMRGIICMASICLVWIVAVLCFAFIKLIIPSLNATWLSFIYAIPVSAIILLVLCCVWKKRLIVLIAESILVWSILLAIYLTLSIVLPTPLKTLWVLFIIGIPIQALFLIWFFFKKVDKK
ncbi:MAG: helix-turn-helix domain-containing protein [Clostridia bacterium]|nr:helix-turn-helix domain-containing protein [Clostridia bacterium]